MPINREDWLRSVVPAGTVIAFAGTTAPSGWLLCNGSAISRSTYSALFTAIGSAHGSGDGSTTFHLPDYRGRFLRGVDGTAGNDPDKLTRTAANAGGATGNDVGSVQGDAMQGHFHSTTLGQAVDISTNGSNDRNPGDRLIENVTIGSPITDGINGTPRTTSESRPKNANVNYIIKV